MPNQVFDQWIPVEYSPDVIQRVKQNSAVIAYGQNVPMTTESRSTPRSGGVTMGGIAKGGNYGQDTTTANDAVWLYAQKYGGAVPIAEEDLNDSLADIVNAKTIDAGTSFAKLFDNSCLAVTGAKGTTGWAFDSLYYLLTQSNAVSGYVANANLNKTTAGSGVQYNDLRKPLKQVESGDYFDPGNLVVIAHPSFADSLRGVVDNQGRPIFNESSNGTAGGGQGGGATLFGHPVHWSLGAKTSATPTPTPTGNPLLIIASANYMLVGNREPLSVQNIDGNTGLGALSDTAYLKFRSRRAFAVGHENAFAILENVG
ncbi:phage major capsid protein [Amycolatopsis sp. NPDC051373]|uniref:phage major capsid protein n=1 Tax=Amycolatopsis sp. NPDC051373 TaxID=3155801 RepID=UPI00344C175E